MTEYGQHKSDDPYLILHGDELDPFPLTEGEVQVGRAEGNDLRLEDDSVSRRHARLTRQGPTVFLEDLGSSNGTFVNDRQITQRVQLKDGDRIGFADIDAVFHATHEVAAPLDDAAMDDRERRKQPPLAALEAVGLPPVLLESDETVLGRGADNDVVLDDPGVSSRHASIRRMADDFVLADLESANGTFVNRERVRAHTHTLQPGDEIRLGDTILVFRRLAPVRRPAPGGHRR